LYWPNSLSDEPAFSQCGHDVQPSITIYVDDLLVHPVLTEINVASLRGALHAKSGQTARYNGRRKRRGAIGSWDVAREPGAAIFNAVTTGKHPIWSTVTGNVDQVLTRNEANIYPGSGIFVRAGDVCAAEASGRQRDCLRLLVGQRAVVACASIRICPERDRDVGLGGAVLTEHPY